jgi:putative flippase GtrA
MAVGLLSQPVFTSVIGSADLYTRLAIFFGFTALAPFALFIASLLGRIAPVLYQFAKFGAVGTMNTFLDLGVLSAEMIVSGAASGAAYVIFKAISFLVATTNSFFWNKHWTFGAYGRASAAETAKFYIVAAVGWGLNVLSASLVVNAFPRPDVISPPQWGIIGAMVGVAASFLWNFLGYKFFVFPRQEIQEKG